MRTRKNTALFSEFQKERLGYYPCSRVDNQAILAQLFIDLGHEVNYEVDEFLFIHFLNVKVGDEEADVVTLNRFPSKDDETLGPLHQESHEHLTLDARKFVGLLDTYANSYRVDGGLNERLLASVSADDNWSE